MAPNYEVPAYVVDGALLAAHSTPRVMGGNQLPELTSESFNDLTNRKGALYAYLVGAVVPSVVLILFFIIWLITLCCVKCCNKKSQSRHLIAAIVFGICGIASCICWFIAMGGNATVVRGVNTLVSAVGDVFDLGKNATGIAYQVGNLTQDITDIAEQANTSCSVPGAPFPLNEITYNMENINKQFQSQSGSLTSGFNDLQGQFKTGTTEVGKYVQWETTATWIVTIVAVVFTAVFCVTTLIRIFDKTPGPLLSCVRILNKISTYFIFIVGTLVLLVIIIICAILNVINLVGSDICLPDPSTNINKLVASTLQVSDSSCAAGSAYVSQPIGNLICYYQTCEGENVFDNYLKEANFSQAATFTNLTGFTDTVSQLPPPYNESAVACTNAMTELGDTLATGLDGVVASVRKIIACSSINPIYVKFLYTGLCNSLVGGLVVTASAMIAASVFLMISMLLYLTFDMQAITLMQGGKLIQNPSQLASTTSIPIATEVKG